MRVNIEISGNGWYNAYLPDLGLPFGAMGEGQSAAEARQDFMNVVKGYTEKLGKQKEMEEVEFDFHYDVPSFLQHYSKVFTLAGLSRITGIAQGQLSHYLNGYRKPSPKTVKKIQDAIHELGRSMASINFV